MIVECINDNWKSNGVPIPPDAPKRGNLYEVTGSYWANSSGENRYYYYLREVKDKLGWWSGKFKEVDIDISDINEKKLNELLIEAVI